MKEPLRMLMKREFSCLKNYLFIIGIATMTLLSSAQVNAQTPGATLQPKTITGSVTDVTTNETLIGVNVTIEGTTKGTITDVNGEFSMVVTDPKSVLVFNYLGYETVKQALSDKNILNIALSPSVKGLDEVVVVGYGTSKKKDLTGAMANVGSKDFNQGAITNPLQQIAGKAAGVNITQVGNEPGVAPSVRIRGITSLIGGSDPLVVVDGIQGNLDLLSQIPSSEIESVDILKDASATAIYGSRGAPGVILVTTKKSKAGQFTVDYNGSYSVDAISNKIDLLSADQWRQQSAIWNVPVSADHGSNTDWYNILTKVGYTQNHTVSFGGGANNFNYRASVAAVLQDGVVLNSGVKNYTGRLQATQKAMDDKLTLTMTLSSGIGNTIGSPTGVGNAAFRSNLISNAYVARPTDPVYTSNGKYFTDTNVFQYINPYAVSQEVTNETEKNNLFGSLRADYEIISGLKAGVFGSWRKEDKFGGYYEPAASTIAQAIDNNGYAKINTDKVDEKLMDLSLNYKKSFGEHNLEAMGVYEWQNQTYQGNQTIGRSFINDATTYNAIQLGDITKVKPGDISSYKNDRTLVSFLGRLNYSFKSRYLLTLSMRRDGSSVFGANNKWGDFPSASVAWRLNEESFMSGIESLNELKLRAGYGVTGNQQGLSPQKSLELIGGNGVTYFNGSSRTNYGVTQNSNSDLKWETRYQTNVGLDFAMFDNRLFGSIDAYSATTKNLLFDYAVPQPPYPYSTVTANVGSLLNEGLEITLNYVVLRNDDMSLTLGGNLSFLRNEVLELSGDLNGVPLNTDYVGWGTNLYLIKGQPVGTFNILSHSGKDANNEETVVDQNGDGTIDQGNQSPDRTMQGSALPTYTYAFNPTFTYKNFDMSLTFRGSGGNKIYNQIKPKFSYFENLGKSNLFASSTEEGLYTSKYGSNLWLEDGSFLRFENINLGYKINTGKMKHITGLRVSLTASNLYVWTKYTGLDPEVNVGGGKSDTQFGIDNGIYPRTRSIALGLNVNFK